ncbi:Crp/Fnr family transcriptional regulator [Clostridium sp. MSJ-11]|uniref:Crp/Fnr family transcriptional regulator n=1 Tax=Clostridium mobile TaxID=2841512 RepID=A0ABS6EIR4_9CLOT|nr:Crp/Fnr family transcriptional regulator [Clostridium mobile]MBU5485102.1 Crp/Fnr family transcriptional regulator [Clostridium mobile]
MYESFFDNDRQSFMRNYFLNELSKMGKIEKYKKNEIIDIEGNVGIIVKGVVKQSIISVKGDEKLLYLIRPGEVLGEMTYFCGGKDYIVTIAKENSQIAIINRDILEMELSKNPEVYRHFIHSMTRKFRIVMLQLTNNMFNDSIGKIADALLRLSACAEIDSKERISVNMIYTHQELANNIGCSRITVTRCLKKFQDEGIISYENKNIIINKPNGLKEYINTVVEE